MDQKDNFEDEFEMRPITPGLGFQKRQVSLKEHVSKTGIANSSARRTLPTAPPDELLDVAPARSAKEIISELHKALEKPAVSNNGVRITETLPRAKDAQRAQDIYPESPYTPTKPGPSPLDRVNFQIPDKKIADPTTGVRRGASDGLIAPLSPTAVSFGAMVLDAAIMFATTLIFLVSLMSVTGINALSVFTSAQSEFPAQLSLVVLYFSVYLMYVVVSRSFFGCTVGEWTFDLQVGENEQIDRASYPARVLLRAAVNLVTGLFLLPIFSLIFGRDLAGSISGIRLYRKN